MFKSAGRLFAMQAFAFLLACAVKGQDKKGYITFLDGGDDFSVLRIDIVQKDSLIKTTYLYKETSIIITDTLPVGKYDLRIYNLYGAEGSADLLLTIYNIRIREEEILKQTIDLPDSYYRSAKRTPFDSVRQEGWIYMGYGTKTIETDRNYPVNGSYAAGMGGHTFFVFTRNYALGYMYGTTMSLSTFDKSKPLKPYIPYNSERYFYWNANLGITNRITAFNFQDEEAAGFFIDVYAAYNFPIMFRHTMIEGAHKMIDSRIHQFTDFSVGARIGYYPVSLQVDYRLTDYVIAGYPEMPQLRFGLAFTFPSY